jgi:hypothetical protein
MDDWDCANCHRHFDGGGVVVDSGEIDDEDDENESYEITVMFCVECTESAVRQAKVIGLTDEVEEEEDGNE